MSKKNNLVFKFLHVVAWIIFVGLCIEAGGLLVNFFLSLYKPEFVQNLYQKLDLSSLYQQSEWSYYCVYSFLLAISILKAYLFYIVIVLLHKMDLEKPFDSFVSHKISQISYYTLSIGLLSYLAQDSVSRIARDGFVSESLRPFWADSQAFVLMAAVIYIVSAIFERGVALQNENDLTV
jgi:hypothetical protein